MKLSKLVIFYLFILLLTPWILELIITNFKITKQSDFEPLKKSKQISNERYEKIKFFLSKDYFPSYTVNHGLKNTNYFLDLVNKYKFFPVGSFPDKKTYFCDEGYGFITFNTDHLGLRNPKNEWMKKYPYNTIIVGDSYIHGACVKTGNDISGVLRKNGRQVINLGLIDNQPIQYFYLIEKFTKPKPPKNLVLVFYQGNDFYYSKYKNQYLKLASEKGIKFSSKDNFHTLDTNAINFYKELTNYNLKEINNYLKNKVNEEVNHSNNFRNLIKLNKIRERLESKYSIIIKKKLVCYREYCLIGSLDELFSDTKLAISSLIKNCNPESNCNPVVALIPHNSLWTPGKIHTIKKKYFDKIVFNTIKENNFLSYFDFSKVVDRNDLKYYAPSGGHFSNEGYRIFAKNLEKFLK